MSFFCYCIIPVVFVQPCTLVFLSLFAVIYIRLADRPVETGFFYCVCSTIETIIAITHYYPLHTSQIDSITITISSH